MIFEPSQLGIWEQLCSFVVTNQGEFFQSISVLIHCPLWSKPQWLVRLMLLWWKSFYCGFFSIYPFLAKTKMLPSTQWFINPSTLVLSLVPSSFFFGSEGREDFHKFPRCIEEILVVSHIFLQPRFYRPYTLVSRNLINRNWRVENPSQSGY